MHETGEVEDGDLADQDSEADVDGRPARTQEPGLTSRSGASASEHISEGADDTATDTRAETPTSSGAADDSAPSDEPSQPTLQTCVHAWEPAEQHGGRKGFRYCTKCRWAEKIA